MQHFRFHKKVAINVNKCTCSKYIDGYLLIQKVSRKSRMLFCQLFISALTRHKDLLDFDKVFIEFIPSSETPVSTRSRLPKYQEK